MTIYLIRHGKTEANEKHLYCGKTDLPLTEEGKMQLKKRIIPQPETVRYITSGMRRANETLEILFGEVPFTVAPGLREMDFGSFEMRSYDDLKDDPAYIRWISGDNEANVTPGGESGNQMRSRAMKAFREIADEGLDSIIVTHGGVISVVMQQLFPEENKNRYQWQSANGSGYKLIFSNGEWIYEGL